MPFLGKDRQEETIFYFFMKISWNNWQEMTWTTLLNNDLGFYYLLNGIRYVDLDLHDYCWIPKYLTLLQTTLTFSF